MAKRRGFKEEEKGSTHLGKGLRTDVQLLSWIILRFLPTMV